MRQNLAPNGFPLSAIRELPGRPPPIFLFRENVRVRAMRFPIRDGGEPPGRPGIASKSCNLRPRTPDYRRVSVSALTLDRRRPPRSLAPPPACRLIQVFASPD